MPGQQSCCFYCPLCDFPSAFRKWSSSKHFLVRDLSHKQFESSWSQSYKIHIPPMQMIMIRSGPVFCLLLGVSSNYAQPITGQVTEVTCPVIGRAQPELSPRKRQKRGQTTILNANEMTVELCKFVTWLGHQSKDSGKNYICKVLVISS